MHELRSLLPYLKPYRRAFLAGLTLVVISNFFADPGPPVSPARNRRPARRRRFPRGAESRWRCCCSWPLAGGVARYGMRELLNSGSRRVETDLRDQLYDHLQRMSAEFYDRYPTGDVMARTTNDLLAVRMVAGPALMYLVDTTIQGPPGCASYGGHQPPADPARPGAAARPAGGHGVARPRHPSPVAGDSGPVQRAHQPRPRESVRGPRRAILSPGARGDRRISGR